MIEATAFIIKIKRVIGFKKINNINILNADCV
jgi:hypothetical protein